MRLRLILLLLALTPGVALAADVAQGATVRVSTPISGTTAGGLADKLLTDGVGHLVTTGGATFPATQGTSAEVLVLNTATVVGGLSGRSAIEIQNNGPGDIWCAASASGAVVPVVGKGRRIATGGNTWTLDVTDLVVVKCIAAVSQVTGAGAWVTEAKP